MLISYLPHALAICLAFSPNPGSASCSDLSLVLAIDSSSSIDKTEFALQVAGYAAAFDHPAVQQALAQTGVVDLAAVFWADSDFGVQATNWYRLRAPRDAQAFAAHLRTTERRMTGDTDIGVGLMAALDMLEQPDRCTIRKVINVSGDGQASPWIKQKRQRFIPLPQARERAAALGVTVNGLAILNADPSLGTYYTTELITGPGAFVIEVTGFDSFGAAIIEKLQREISLPVSASLE